MRYFRTYGERLSGRFTFLDMNLEAFWKGFGNLLMALIIPDIDVSAFRDVSNDLYG